MAKDEQSTLINEEEKAKDLLHQVLEIDEPELSNDKKNQEDIFQKLMDERRNHRKEMLSFVKKLTVSSFVLLCVIVLVQIAMRTLFGNPTFTVLDNYQLNIFAVAVFGEIIGLIFIIVHSLWNDEKYLEKLA